MKTEWDYTDLAEAYVKRPDYAQDAINQMFEITGVKKGDSVCDVGAGVAHLTLMLADYGLQVSAVEPNDEMRKYGMQRTENLPQVTWTEGTGEDTKMPRQQFDLVTFGSSFNVCDRQAALIETKRILKANGWFACMWNHRDLNDPLQIEIENILKQNIVDYSYGTRREDQTQILKDSGIFSRIEYAEGNIIHYVPAEDFIEAWKSHATVYRQSKGRFDSIIGKITELIREQGENIRVPYQTKIWMGRIK